STLPACANTSRSSPTRFTRRCQSNAKRRTARCKRAKRRSAKRRRHRESESRTYVRLSEQRADDPGRVFEMELWEIAPSPWNKTRKKISAAKIPFLNAIKKVMDALRDFWPLDDRTIHYELLGDPPLKHASKPDSVYVNHKNSYNSLTELLTRARLEGIIPMDS